MAEACTPATEHGYHALQSRSTVSLCHNGSEGATASATNSARRVSLCGERDHRRASLPVGRVERHDTTDDLHKTKSVVASFLGQSTNYWFMHALFIPHVFSAAGSLPAGFLKAIQHAVNNDHVMLYEVQLLNVYYDVASITQNILLNIGCMS